MRRHGEEREGREEKRKEWKRRRKKNVEQKRKNVREGEGKGRKRTKMIQFLNVVTKSLFYLLFYTRRS